MKKNLNKRCPLQTECERTCKYEGHELDCDYYEVNARPDYEIADQEERRQEIERRRTRELEEAMMAELPDEEAEPQEEVSTKGKLIYIPIDKLFPHPDNPRKELGDLTELAASIKANGVFQNLTVVKKFGEITKKWNGNYTIIIGHRRCAAAKLAGLTELPCVVAEMTPQEQLSTMLLENMQRSDLTVYEQAQSFQILIDMGESVDSVASKTGFSSGTVRRRLKMTELDQKVLKQVSSRPLSLGDFDKLAQIEDLAAVHTWGGKAATALKALGTAAAANPTALAVTGVVALTAALATLAATSEKAESEFAGLAVAIRSAGEEWSKQTVLMAEQREKAEGLADQLEYLQENADGSAAASQALQNVQQQLLATVPELAEYINAETGALEGNWRQALASAAATDEQAAAMERQAAVATQLAEVQTALAAREAEMQKLEAEGITLADAASGSHSKLNPVLREKYERMRELGVAANELRTAEAQLLAQQKELEAAAAGWADKSAGIIPAIDSTMQQAVEHMDVAEGAEQSAANTMKGYIGGIEELAPRLNSAMRNAGRGGLVSFNTALDMHSPSREFAKSGRNSMQGYINGAGELTNTVREAMQSIGRAALDSFGDGAAAGSAATMAAMQTEADAAWKLAQSSYSNFNSL